MDEKFGRHFGKFDLDRVGFFSDSPPGPFEVYKLPEKFRVNVAKGRPQIISGPPLKYFEKKFGRIFEDESLTEPWREDAMKRIQAEKRKIGGLMLPSSPSKKRSGAGDWYGCFSKSSYFIPDMEGAPIRKIPVLPNVKIKPNPLGGPGYADICLNPYPSYTHELYEHERKRKTEPRFLTVSAPLDYFPPNPYVSEPGSTYMRPKERKVMVIQPNLYIPFPKRPGGCHDGCFSKFPVYESDPYIKPKGKPKAEPRFLTASPPLRSKYTSSALAQITKASCNSQTYREYGTKVYPRYV